MAKNIAVKTIRDFAKEQGMDKSEMYDIFGLEIEIKKYIPMEKKREIALLVNQNSFIKGQSDIQLYDKAFEDVVLNVLIIKEYTNINLMKDHFEFYDCLKSSGLLDTIISYIDENEIKEIKSLVESRKEDVFRVQELKGKIGYQLENVFNIISDKLGDVSEQIANFNPEILTTLLDFMPDDKKRELLNKKMTKAEKERIKELEDENMKKKIKIVEDKVKDFVKVEENNLAESPILNKNESE